MICGKRRALELVSSLTMAADGDGGFEASAVVKAVDEQSWRDLARLSLQALQFPPTYTALYDRQIHNFARDIHQKTFL